MKKLYFTDDFSPENVAKLKGQGYILRDIRAYNVGDFIEDCDEVAGDVPAAYQERYGEVAPSGSELPDFSQMKVDELRQFLTDNGVEFDAKATKAELSAQAEALAQD